MKNQDIKSKRSGHETAELAAGLSKKGSQQWRIQKFGIGGERVGSGCRQKIFEHFMQKKCIFVHNFYLF